MAIDLKKQFGADPKKEEEGVWEDLGDGGSLLIARVSNKRYNRAYQRIPRGIRRQFENGTLPSSKGDDIVCGLLAGTVLLDFKGIADDGVSIDYSKEAAKELLLRYPDFRELVWQIANEARRFFEDSIEEDEKNLESSSTGS